MLKLPPQPDCCELCQRPVAKLTRHHLIPRRLHSKKRFQKLFTRDDMITRTLWVCRPCHNAIHGICSEYELGLHYNTRDKLMKLDDLRTFVDWLRDKPEGFVPKRGRRG